MRARARVLQNAAVRGANASRDIGMLRAIAASLAIVAPPRSTLPCLISRNYAFRPVHTEFGNGGDIAVVPR